VVKGTVIPPRTTCTVPVCFDPNLAAVEQPATATILCTPIPVYDRRGDLVPFAFPLHLAPTAANRHGLYHLYINNATNAPVSLLANTTIGTALLYTDNIASITPQSHSYSLNPATDEVTVTPLPSAAAAVSSPSSVSSPAPAADPAQPPPAPAATEPSSSSSPGAQPSSPSSPAPAAPSTPIFHINTQLSAAEQQLIQAALLKNQDVFEAKAQEGPPRALGVEFTIHTGDAVPIKQPAYRQPRDKEQYIETEVQTLLKKGLITPSLSPWASPVLVVGKKDGTFRMCIDYRKLNSCTTKDAYPLPRIEDCLESCKDSEWLSIVDLRDAYHHIPMNPASEPATAFVTKAGLYQWKVMPFGATGAPGCFQRYVDLVFRGLTGTVCTVYFDDIVVHTKGSLEQHLLDLDKVFARMREYHLSGKISKCRFAMHEVVFVGHLVSKGTIRPDPDKLRAIQEFPVPTDVPHLKSFLGLANYYRRFLEWFARIALPLYALTKKDRITKQEVPFVWTQECDAAFQKIKDGLTTAPCLHAPVFSKPFIMQTDASNKGVSAILTQHFDDGEHPICFASRQLLPAEMNYSTSEQEALAIVFGMQQYEHYLLSKPFTIVTDHHALVWFPGKKSTNKRLQRWSILMSQFDFKVQYRKGKDNANADALSRHPVHNTGVEQLLDHTPQHTIIHNAPFVAANAASARKAKPRSDVLEIDVAPSEPITGYFEHTLITPEDLQTLAQEQGKERRLQEIIAYLQKKEVPADLHGLALTRFKNHTPLDYEMIALPDDQSTQVLCRKKKTDSRQTTSPRLVIPTLYQEALFAIYHDSPFAGHMGIQCTYQKLAQRYWWTNMYEDTVKYVNGCKTCQEFKVQRHPLQHGPHHIQRPTEPFQVIAMDYLTMPESLQFKYVLVIVDLFTHWAITIPTQNMLAETTARVIMHEVICKHGCPRTVLSDNGSAFKNSTVIDLYKALGIKRHYAPTYHPQTNGVAERFVGTIKNIIRSFTATKADIDWLYYLQPATFAYNSSPSAITGISPFMAIYGHLPSLPLDLPDFNPMSELTENAQESYAAVLHDRLMNTTEVVRKLTADRNLKAAAESMKLTHIPVFATGDLVYLKQPSSTADASQHNWIQPFKGPYRVTKRLGQVLYEIMPADTSLPRVPKVHQVHVQRLKPYTIDADASSAAVINERKEPLITPASADALRTITTAKPQAPPAELAATKKKKTSKKPAKPPLVPRQHLENLNKFWPVVPHGIHPSRAQLPNLQMPTSTKPDTMDDVVPEPATLTPPAPHNLRRFKNSKRIVYNERLARIAQDEALDQMSWYSNRKAGLSQPEAEPAATSN
jgi:transposase InsO family protein